MARSLAWPWLAAAREGMPATAVAGDHSGMSLKLGHPAGSLLSKRRGKRIIRNKVPNANHRLIGIVLWTAG